MATHSYAYIPTNRKPGEYIMSEGWSDGYLANVGFAWYESVPRLVDAVRATMLLGGSPVFAPPERLELVIKEIDFIEEGIADVTDDNDEFMIGVASTLAALERGNFKMAEATDFGRMSFEDKKAQDLTLNSDLHTIRDFADVPEYGTSACAFDLGTLANAFSNENQKALAAYTIYFYHPTLKQWWGQLELPGGAAMWVPLVLGFFIAEKSRMQEVQALHEAYPKQYKRDIADLAAFRAAVNQ